MYFLHAAGSVQAIYRKFVTVFLYLSQVGRADDNVSSSRRYTTLEK